LFSPARRGQSEHAEVLAGGLLLLEVLLLVLSLLEIEVLLSDGLEPLAVVLLELLGSILVDGVGPLGYKPPVFSAKTTSPYSYEIAAKAL